MTATFTVFREISVCKLVRFLCQCLHA